ncbi:transposable element Tcb1 transposase [Trichonephila clavipes]|nr:transposable element Tcb1 transposase [Trichonephila clavipes]
MIAQRYVHDILQSHVLPLMQRLPGAIFQLDNTRPPHGEGITRFISALLLPSLALAVPCQICLQSSIPGSTIGVASCASNEFERTRGKVTANMERNVSRHHMNLYSIEHSR